jgi:hypothetical protein
MFGTRKKPVKVISYRPSKNCIAVSSFRVPNLTTFFNKGAGRMKEIIYGFILGNLLLIIGFWLVYLAFKGII